MPTPPRDAISWARTRADIRALVVPDGDNPVARPARPARLVRRAADEDIAWARTRAEIRYRAGDGDWLPVVADEDDEGPLDEDVRALLTALAILCGESHRAAPPGFNAKHPRDSKGRFRTVVDRLIDALKQHKPGSNADPFDGFDREQLRRAAKARGLSIPRGASRDHIAAALLKDLGGSGGTKTPTAPTPGPPAKPKTAPAAALQAAFGGPPVAAPTSTTAKLDVQVQAALDVLYGTDPKSRTAARQLAVYGVLRREQFDRLDSAEKSTLLGDLHYIASTSKGPNAAKAQKVLDRFTPPGTAPGVVPTQTVATTPNMRSSQNRYPDAGGRSGVLTVLPAAHRGRSGDGWIRLSNGTSGPWGQYGASGLLLRHVDDDGTERFLMVQRGPGISDPGKWQFPGGARDQHESMAQGAAREVVEELGLLPRDLDKARVHGEHTMALKSGEWQYTSFAADVDTQLQPDLSSHHARMETADAKWLTRDEIRDLNTKGKLLKPLAGGQLEQNVMSLFPAAPSKSTTAGGKPTRPARLSGTPKAPLIQTTPHKPSKGTDLMADTTAKNALRQAVKQARTKYAGKVADDRLAAIGGMQGFDDVPTVVSKAEMDRLLATGDYIEAWRGVRGMGAGRFGPTRGGVVSATKTAAQISEEFRSGPAFYGRGVFGNGYYFATKRSVAETYADKAPGSIVRVLIPKSAKMMGHDQARKEARAASSPRSQAKGSYEDGTLYDEGRYAAARGIDMIEITVNSASAHVASKNKPSYLILNRSVLIVEEA